MRAVLSSGSNMGDARAHLQSVADEFAGEILAVSSIYATAPWGKTDQADFLNQSLLVDVDETPRELLARCQDLEQRANRVREERWGPRTLDVDIVWIEGYTSDDPELTVPHPRAHLRRFVLEPWFEVDPGAVLNGTRISELLEGLEDQGVRKL